MNIAEAFFLIFAIVAFLAWFIVLPVVGLLYLLGFLT